MENKIEKRKCFYYDKELEEMSGDGCCTCIECYIGGHCQIAVERMTEEEKKFYSAKYR